MRNIFAFILIFLPLTAFAEHEFSNNAILTDTHSTIVEMRQSAGFSWGLPKGFDISLEEELREVIHNSSVTPSAYFSKSYTTVEAGWKFLSVTEPSNNYKYGLKLTAGYTLRFLNNKVYKEEVKQGANAYLRHRPHVSLTGSADFGNLKLSLRERWLMDCRTDSVNELEKARLAMELRHRIRLDYSIPGKPLKPYIGVELTNTLNEPTCPWINPETGRPFYGGQYLNSVRASIGLKWRIDKHNSLTFSYLYHFEQEREVNITRKENISRLYMAKESKHILMIAYELGY